MSLLIFFHVHKVCLWLSNFYASLMSYVFTALVIAVYIISSKHHFLLVATMALTELNCVTKNSVVNKL